MKRLQLKRLKYWYKSFGLKKGIKYWIKDIKYALERCEWCGWYLHPQLIFKNIKRPPKLGYRKNNGQWVCAKCYYLNNVL